MIPPGENYLIYVITDYLLGSTNFSLAKPSTSIKLDLGFYPEFSFAGRRKNVHVHTRLLSRKEGESIRPFPKYRRTHIPTLPYGI